MNEDREPDARARAHEDRPPWDAYFSTMAAVAATRATCPRLRVGCVIVRDHDILATGYNGSARGKPHCTEAGCLMIDGHCERTVHAEANAIAQAARKGTAIEGATAYVTHFPCANCMKTLVAAGVVRIVYTHAYENTVTRWWIEHHAIEIVQAPA